MRPTLLTILICSLIVSFAASTPVDATPAASSSIDIKAIDTYISGQMAKHGLPGISLALTQGDQIAYLKGYGTAGAGRPMTAQTPMYIGSQSKSFTGLAIAQLIEQGKVNASDPVVKYIPWFKVADPLATQKITISNLLHHTSGLSDAGYTSNVPENASLEEGVRSLATARLTAPVGQKFQYFNMGYCVLMQVIENVSGQKYAGYIQQHIFTPLGMVNSYTDPAAAKLAGLSQGYSRFFGFTVPRTQPHLAYQLGDGYLISTAEDLAHFTIAMSNQGAFLGVSVVSPEMLARVFLPINGYAMGWFVANDHIYHGGANETFKTFVDLYPSRHLSIVLLINQGYTLDHYISAEQVFKGVEAIALGKQPPAIAQGFSVRLLGWALLGLVLALVILHSWNIAHLKVWREKLGSMSVGKKIWGVAISFIIPTLILAVVYTQSKSFFGDRFNLSYQVVMMFKTLPDIAILCLIATVPDYVQGVIKLAWVVSRAKSDSHS